ncbi:MAG TPA: hypothetical protein VF061_03630 [Gemmatimonadales bacterium]
MRVAELRHLFNAMDPAPLLARDLDPTVPGFIVALVLPGILPEVLRGGMAGVASESLFIGGWVAMWRPLEVFLYDWWPIRAEARRLDRLAAMPVGIGEAPGEAPESR